MRQIIGIGERRRKAIAEGGEKGGAVTLVADKEYIFPNLARRRLILEPRFSHGHPRPAVKCKHSIIRIYITVRENKHM